MLNKLKTFALAVFAIVLSSCFLLTGGEDESASVILKIGGDVLNALNARSLAGRG